MNASWPISDTGFFFEYRFRLSQHQFIGEANSSSEENTSYVIRTRASIPVARFGTIHFWLVEPLNVMNYPVSSKPCPHCAICFRGYPYTVGLGIPSFKLAFASVWGS